MVVVTQHYVYESFINYVFYVFKRFVHFHLLIKKCTRRPYLPTVNKLAELYPVQGSSFSLKPEKCAFVTFYYHRCKIHKKQFSAMRFNDDWMRVHGNTVWGIFGNNFFSVCKFIDALQIVCCYTVSGSAPFVAHIEGKNFMK